MPKVVVGHNIQSGNNNSIVIESSEELDKEDIVVENNRQTGDNTIIVNDETYDDNSQSQTKTKDNQLTIIKYVVLVIRYILKFAKGDKS